MLISDFLGAILMALVGLICSALVIDVAQSFGFSGWIVGPVFCVLILLAILINDRLMGFEIGHVVRFLAKQEGTELSEVDKKEIDSSFGSRREYIGFLVGAVFGLLTSLLFAPSIVFDLLPF